jgi:hypothetical protein
LVGSQPGGGGGGARGSSTGSQTLGGTGGAGQIILTVKAIAKADQSITGLAATDTKTYGSVDYTLSVTKGASGSSLTFGSSKTDVATIDGTGLVHIKGAGETTITVNQPADENYNAASSVQQTLTVAKGTQTINFGALPSKTYGDIPFNLSATASSGLGVTYSSSESNVASISGSTVTILKAGSTTITASQSGNDNYNAATSVYQTLTINASGTTFGGYFSGVSPTNVGSDGLTYLMKYALGGTNTNDRVAWPIVSMNGSSLTLTANVRTNDTNLTIVGQSTTDLAGTWTTISPNSNGVPSTNTNSSAVPAGCQRRDFTVSGGSNNRTFLKLKVSQ